MRKNNLFKRGLAISLSLAMILGVIPSLDGNIKEIQAATDYSITSTDKYNIVEASKSAIGCGYVSGQAGPKVFDSAGLIYYAFKQAKIPWTDTLESSQQVEGSTVSVRSLETVNQAFIDANFFVEYLSADDYQTLEDKFGTSYNYVLSKYKVEKGDIISFFNSPKYEQDTASGSSDYSDQIPYGMAICSDASLIDNSGYKISYIGIFDPRTMVAESALTAGDSNSSYAIYHLNNNGAFRLRKTVADNQPIANVQYEITLPNGNKEIKTTDIDGSIVYTDVISGTYKYKQISDIDGYVTDNHEYTTFVYNGDTLESHTIQLSSKKGYSLKKSTTSHGSYVLNKEYAAEGDAIVISPKPNNGYTVDKVKVSDSNNAEIKTTIKNGTYTFTMPKSEVRVEVQFKAIVKPTTPTTSAIKKPVQVKSFTVKKTGKTFTLKWKKVYGKWSKTIKIRK